MNPEERLVADFRGTGDRRPPSHGLSSRAHGCDRIQSQRSQRIPNGRLSRIGGCVIARQRPGTAKGFLFLSLEDETGVANAIIMPDLFRKTGCW